MGYICCQQYWGGRAEWTAATASWLSREILLHNILNNHRLEKQTIGEKTPLIAAKQSPGNRTALAVR